MVGTTEDESPEGGFVPVADMAGIYRVVWQDPWLVVLDKAPGVLVIPAPDHRAKVLTELLPGLHPCHRLDLETSGLVVFARSKARQKRLMDLFHHHALDKIYLAVLNGTLTAASGRLNRPLEGKDALTEYRLIAARQGLSVVLVRLHTGRTNQIRLHFSQAGLPLLGDARFGRRKEFAVPFRRTALHALRLRFTHPWTHEELSFFAPLPEDLSAVLSDLGVALPQD